MKKIRVKSNRPGTIVFGNMNIVPGKCTVEFEFSDEEYDQMKATNYFEMFKNDLEITWDVPKKPYQKTIPIKVHCNYYCGHMFGGHFVKQGYQTLELTPEEAMAFKQNPDVQREIANHGLRIESWGAYDDYLIVNNIGRYSKIIDDIVLYHGINKFKIGDQSKSKWLGIGNRDMQNNFNKFNITSQPMHTCLQITLEQLKNFREDPRTQEFINNKEIEILSWGDCHELPTPMPIYNEEPQPSQEPLQAEPVEDHKLNAELSPAETPEPIQNSAILPQNHNTPIQAQTLEPKPDPTLYSCEATIDENLISNIMG